MAEAIIPLSTKLSLKKMEGNSVFVSEKYDGVPVIFTVYPDGTVYSRTRPGKPTGPSVQHICDELSEFAHPDYVFNVVAEIMSTEVKGFKNVSGRVRKQVNDPSLYGHVFDYCIAGHEDMPYHQRRVHADGFARRCVHLRKVNGYEVFGFTADYYRRLKAFIQHETQDPDNFEGWIVRDLTEPYEPNKRQPGYCKDVIEPMVDLPIWGYIEAVSKDGEAKGMAGGLVAWYKDGYIGIGPGKLSHDEREALMRPTAEKMVGLPGKPNQVWWRFTASRMAQIKHKKDDQYKALRQPTFQFWREDKDA